LAALPQSLEPRNFVFAGGYNQFAGLAVFDSFGPAISPQRAAAFDAELGFERSGRVVDSGVNDAAVAAGLVGSDALFFLQNCQPQARMTQQEFASGCEADDACPHDGNVVHTWRLRATCEQARLWS